MLWFLLSSMHTPAWVETDSTSSLLCAVYYLTGLSATVVFHACHSLNSSSRVLTSIMLTAVSLLSVLIRAIVHGRNTWTDSVSLLMQQRVTLSPSSMYNISQVSINEAFSPLLGVDVTLQNNLTARLEYRQTRVLSLSMTSVQFEWSLIKRLGYRYWL